ncbi:MAG TPA: type II secretion system protein [Stellaceae bacterium]|nr:type II secretion system protein [Stellaceae bacterium]
MSERGFTLLEVLVAFAILLLAVGVLLPLFSGTLDQSARSEEEARAASIARSLLERVGTELPLADGTLSGETEGYGWRLAIEPLGSSDDRASWAEAAHRVDVTVEWRAAGRVRRESASTIRLGPRPAPP